MSASPGKQPMRLQACVLRLVVVSDQEVSMAELQLQTYR